jgi:hypothetical protein
MYTCNAAVYSINLVNRLAFSPFLFPSLSLFLSLSPSLSFSLLLSFSFALSIMAYNAIIVMVLGRPIGRKIRPSSTWLLFSAYFLLQTGYLGTNMIYIYTYILCKLHRTMYHVGETYLRLFMVIKN